MAKKKGRTLTFIWLALAVTASLARTPEPPHQHHVLLLHSYEVLSPWTHAQQHGFYDIMESWRIPMTLHMDSLDCRNYHSSSYFPQLAQTLKAKYRHLDFDLVLLTDDEALRFALQYREQLFPGVPLVFSGVDHYLPEEAAGLPYLSGVLENLELRKNLEMAVKLFPNATQLVALGDADHFELETEKAMLRSIRDDVKPTLKLRFLTEYLADEKKRALRQLPPGSLLFLLGPLQDEKGQPMSLTESVAWTREASEAPLFSFWEVQIGEGILGGYLVDGEAMGRKAAQMALAVLQGEEPENVPLVWDHQYRLAFDYRELKRLGIPLSRLPAEAEILFRPPSLLERHRRLFQVGLLFLLLESLTIVVLVWNVYKRRLSEIRLQEGMAGLEQRVLERTRDLEEQSRKLQQEVEERRQTEKFLRESQERYQRLYDSSPIGVFHSTIEGYFVDVNPFLAQTLGFDSPQEMMETVNQSDIASSLFSNPEDRLTLVDRLLEAGDKWTGFEGKYLHRDGKTLIYADLKIRLLDKEKGIMEGLAVDVTARKKAEKNLRTSERMLQLVIDNVPQYVYWKDRDNKYLGCNVSFARMIGFREPGLVIGKTDQELYKEPEKQAYLQEADRRVMETGHGEFHMVEQHQLANGRTAWLDTNKVPLFDEKGEIIGVLATQEDISERVRYQNALRESEERYRMIFNYSPLGIMHYDQNGVIRSFNEKFLEILNLKPEHILHENLFKIVMDTRVTDAVTQAMETGTGHYEGDYTTASSGTTTPLRAAFRSIITQSGERKGGITIVEDISQHRQAEKERRRLEAQVQQAQKLESLGVLAGGIAHDFNNLLMSILGNADLALLELSRMSPAYRSVKEIEKASQRAADLCRQMLAYSGKGKFVVEPINLNELVEEMAHLLEVSISKRAVLKYHFADNLPLFEGDATQIRQVIMNLITNASEALEEKSGVISIQTGAMDCDADYLKSAYLDEAPPAGYYVYMEVADTGVGMSRETQDKIFDPFFTTKFAGRGLGLSAVLGIVRSHSGLLKLYSEIGKGTTFKVLFPVSELPALGLPVPPQFGDPETLGGTILLVDDEETVLSVGKRMLEKLGFSVETALNGIEALELFKQKKDQIACVILDLTMPRMDGEETFRELRRLDDSVRVILSSGYNEQEVTNRFAGKGLAGFIQKPYQSSLLYQKIREILPQA